MCGRRSVVPASIGDGVSTEQIVRVTSGSLRAQSLNSMAERFETLPFRRVFIRKVQWLIVGIGSSMKKAGHKVPGHKSVCVRQKGLA